jgi:hypothetical protein
VDVGITQTLTTPGGTITFNVFTAGEGYHLTNVTGIDQATIRNPTTPKPHGDGFIVHRFRRGATFIVIEGVIVAKFTTTRVTLTENLRAALNSIVYGGPGAGATTDGTYSWTPPGAAARSFTVRVYEPLEILSGGASAGGSPQGIAGPKEFTFTLVSDRPHAWSY